MWFHRNFSGDGSDACATHQLAVVSGTFTPGAALRSIAGDSTVLFATGGTFIGLFTDQTHSVGSTPVLTCATHRHRAGDYYMAAYDTTRIIVSAATVSSFTVSGLSVAAEGGYVYVCSGTGVGQLRRITSVAPATGKTLVSNNWTTSPVAATSYVNVIWPRGRSIILNTAQTQLAQRKIASANSDMRIMDNYVRIGGRGFDVMTLGQHSNLDGLNTLGVEFFAEVVPQTFI